MAKQSKKEDATKKDLKQASHAVEKAPSGAFSKKKASRIVSYEKLDEAVKALFAEKYADGYQDYVTKYPKPNGEFFYAVALDTEDTNYLVKVEVVIDTHFEDDLDKDIFTADLEDNPPMDMDDDMKENTSVEEIADTYGEEAPEAE